MTQLVVMLDKQIIKRFNVQNTHVTVGRHLHNDIALPDRTISIHHARITVVRGDCFLEDLGSTNGTYVNHQRIERHLLNDGDVIGLSQYRLVFRSQAGLETQLRHLSVHPKLVEAPYPAWLFLLNGKKAGCIIPLQNNRITLGNDEEGKLVIEPAGQGHYSVRTSDATTPASSRLLMPEEELELAGISLRFCIAEPDDTHLQTLPDTTGSDTTLEPET